MRKPGIRELGEDLLRLPSWRKALALSIPFALSAGALALGFSGQYLAAFLMLIALSYSTYGSVSHDLVHQCYRLPKALNHLLLSLMELTCLRSGMAYRYAHLKHHQRFPKHDDVEGRAAHFNWFQSLCYGLVFLPLIWLDAFRHARHLRLGLMLELAAILTIWGLAGWLAIAGGSFVLLGYCVVVQAGCWIIPFMTSYLPHLADGEEEVYQTRRFRGRVFATMSLNHLFHLEHHMYPAVPHQNWATLAKRLDPYLDARKVPELKAWF